MMQLNLMRNLLIFVLCILIIGCGQGEKNNSKNKNSPISENKISNPKWRISLVDLSDRLYFEFDTLKGKINADNIIKVINYSFSDPPYNLKMLHPEEIWNTNGDDSISMYPINATTFVIPMSGGHDGDITFFTNWKKIGTDSIEFVNCITPSISSVYSTASVVGHLKKENKIYLICKTIGGEGGEVFQSMWIADYDGVDQMKMGTEVSIGYSPDDGIFSNLDFEITPKGIEIIETRDSMKFENDSWHLIHSNREKIKTFDISLNAPN